MKKEKTNRGTGILLNVILGINIIILIGMGWLFMENKAKIAYVQTNYLLSNYQGFKDASLAYQQKSVIWKSNIDTLAAELRNMKKEFNTDQQKLSAKEKALTNELIKTKQQQLNQYRQGIQQKAAQEDQEMTGSVVQEVNAFLKEYGEKHHYKIIFGATDVGNIVYAQEAIDLTEEVLDEMNKRYSGQ